MLKPEKVKLQHTLRIYTQEDQETLEKAFDKSKKKFDNMADFIRYCVLLGAKKLLGDNAYDEIINLTEIKENLSKRLSEKRYTHSLGTMNAAKELASIYGENVEEAEIAGLIHDVAKELRKDEIEEYLERYNIKPDEIEQIQIGLLHAKRGAVIARDEFNLRRNKRWKNVFYSLMSTGHFSIVLMVCPIFQTT